MPVMRIKYDLIFNGYFNAICLGVIRRNNFETRMWANSKRDGRPAEHRWRPLFNAAKSG